MLRRTALVLVCLVLVRCAAPHPVAEPTARPDVLMICIDDLNDWVGCLGGHAQVRTPNIDRLAARGVLFTNAHCQAPVCLASRVSFLTGRRPSSTGVYLLGPTFRDSDALRDAVTLPEQFAAAGYATLGAGKVFHEQNSMGAFQDYGPGGDFGPLPDEADKLNYTQGHRLWDWGPLPVADEDMPDHRIATWAIERLRERRDRPTFLAVGFVRPHVPMYAPPAWFDRQVPLDQLARPAVLEGDRDDLPDHGKRLTAGFPAPRHEWMVEHDQWDRAVQAYLACVAFVDAQVGRLLDALEESGRADRTIVVLLSDHGFHLGEKARWAKRSLWERSTRVPLVIAGPGISGGRRCAQPAGLIDLYPTLVELCALTDPGDLEGQTLVPQLEDVETPHAPAVTTWWVGNHSVRSARYRYTRYADGSEELYDHSSDPHEWHNLASDPGHAAVSAEHRRSLPAFDHAPLAANTALGCAPEDRAGFGVPD